VETVAPFAEAIEEIRKAGAESCSLCFQCGKCDVVCPWNQVRGFSIRKIVRQAAFGLTEIESDDIWRCTTCGSCPSICPRGVGQIEIGVAIRRVAAEYGMFPESVSAVRNASASLVAEGNPLNAQRATRAEWADGAAVGRTVLVGRRPRSPDHLVDRGVAVDVVNLQVQCDSHALTHRVTL